MTYITDGIRELRGQRQGVCHRCGWTGIVGVVSRSLRKSMGTGRSYGRLCRDCVCDLDRAQAGLLTPGASPPLKPSRSRQVA